MATYSYGKKTRVRRSGVKAVGPTSAELEASMAKYKLPPGPRGDSPGGVTGGSEQGRTGDMRYSSRWSDTVRRNPSAPFGRYESGQPLPENFDRPPGQAIPQHRRRQMRVIPKGGTQDPRRRHTFQSQKGWNS